MKEKAEKIREEAKSCIEPKLKSAKEIVNNINIHINNSIIDFVNYVNQSQECVYVITKDFSDNGMKNMNSSISDFAKAAICVEKVSNIKNLFLIF